MHVRNANSHDFSDQVDAWKWSLASVNKTASALGVRISLEAFERNPPQPKALTSDTLVRARKPVR